ncbi:hypothetical protein N7462_009209 [Penicillium macrosclerotiorum]|uniref:uncharacterized protein n=1 Tax=Penicillium macrosclerotiorum TaxID=303699 RepID=UPI002547CC3C|nr:uncharacterized protein N7462_009209 [Penicillium macrosclerotiorum]KAJ5673770.1 hypothetical protein N7462_009209 [Penicillium macrosclerotiorum]
MDGPTPIPSRLYKPSAYNLDEFQQICSRTVDPATYPLACAVEQNIPIYDIPALDAQSPGSETIAALQDEWHHILFTGPGVFVLRGMYSPTRYEAVLTAADAAFDRIIAAERASHPTKGDHFAAGGTNDRIWNSFSKHALDDPSSLSPLLRKPVAGPLNAVHPGGAAQAPHRDYHFGFMDAATLATYPAATHRASQLLTLQGAVAHSAMPVASGPTRFLPFSQTFGPGYGAAREPAFAAHFAAHYVALPLARGDGVFFNPALMHAAGANVTEPGSGTRRVANLLQVSSAFGKPMEAVDGLPLVERCWGSLGEMYRAGVAGGEGSWAMREVRAFVAAVVEGYPFPTNLDRRPPAPSGMAPESEQDVVMRGLEEGWGEGEGGCGVGRDAVAGTGLKRWPGEVERIDPVFLAVFPSGTPGVFCKTQEIRGKREERGREGESIGISVW